MELGALALIFMPPFITIAALLIFLLIDSLISNSRQWILLVITIIMVAISIEIRIESI